MIRAPLIPLWHLCLSLGAEFCPRRPTRCPTTISGGSSDQAPPCVPQIMTASWDQTISRWAEGILFFWVFETHKHPYTGGGLLTLDEGVSFRPLGGVEEGPFLLKGNVISFGCSLAIAPFPPPITSLARARVSYSPMGPLPGGASQLRANSRRRGGRATSSPFHFAHFSVKGGGHE